MVTGKLSFEVQDVSKISMEEKKRIFEIEKDMWGRKEGLGEYVKCKNCGTICSKQDIFGHVSREIYNKTISEIEKILGIDTVDCSSCGSENTEFMYQEEDYIKDITQRYAQEAFLLLVKDEDQKIVGFIDGYASDIDTIFELELKGHYEDIGVDAIKSAISKKLDGKLPDKMFCCSSNGTVEELKTMSVIFRMLTEFFLSIPSQYDATCGITELNFGNNFHAIGNALGSESLGFSNSQNRTNLSKSFNSDIFIQENFVAIFKQAFGSGTRDFMRKYLHKLK